MQLILVNPRSPLWSSFEHIWQQNPSLVDPEKVWQRMMDSQYDCVLSQGNEGLLAAASMDRRYFECLQISNAVRVHFLWVRNPAQFSAAVHALACRAQRVGARALVWYVPEQDQDLQRNLRTLGFQKRDLFLQHSCPHAAWVHEEVSELARKEEPSRVKNSSFHPMTLQRKYLEMIKGGSKTVEGRINSGPFRGVAQGKGFLFFCQNQKVYCRVEEVKTFTNFREMLRHFGYKSCVPDARSEDAAVSIYESIPGYSERARQHGVVGMRLRVVSPSETPEASFADSADPSRKRRAEEQIGPEFKRGRK